MASRDLRPCCTGLSRHSDRKGTRPRGTSPLRAARTGAGETPLLTLPTRTQRTAARDAATEALEIYRTYGAHRSATLATTLLNDLGTPRRTPTAAGTSRASRPSTGWHSLTRTEQAVAQLVAEGLTNREVAQQLYVSHRTVETHISNGLTKLGARSRVNLAKAALMVGD